jgi:hypothetical protein
MMDDISPRDHADVTDMPTEWFTDLELREVVPTSTGRHLAVISPPPTSVVVSRLASICTHSIRR